MDEKKEFKILFKYYEKAIEGRNFHYQELYSKVVDELIKK